MQTLSYADHFVSTGMTVGMVLFLVIELISVLAFIAIVFLYLRVVSKHRMLPSAIQHTLEEEPEKGVTALLWLYIIMTIIVTIFTAALFMLQPHLY